MLYKFFIRPVLFCFNAEFIHNFVIWFISRFTFIYPFIRLIYSPKIESPVIINGMKFKNRLGIAAGLDKNGTAIRFWDAAGFSHMEIGTVTPKPQPGNPKPRIFRLIKEKGIVNRMGFNNKGADVIYKNILASKRYIKKDFIVGVNIGKNKNTPNENASEDYLICLEKLYDAADFFTINISSPNTPGLRELQNKEELNKLLNNISSKNIALANAKNQNPKVIFLKIAPDLSENEITEIYNSVINHKISGIIATNTTITRDSLLNNPDEEGGLSGKPLLELSNKALAHLNKLNLESEKKIVLVGVGGIFDKNDYTSKLNLGAELVQIYTGFIYEGLNIIKNILNK